MAMSWIAALKNVPWDAVLSNAPTIVDGAKKLWTAVSGNAASAEGDAPEDMHKLPPDMQAIAALDARISALEANVADLQREMLSSAELIKALADQNTRLVEAVALFRARMRLMFAAVTVLGIATTGCLYLLLTR